MSRLYTCLIRTHHITSRKKLHRVRHVANQQALSSLLVRYGGPPGIMYAESDQLSPLEQWVASVQALRYKDFNLAIKPAEMAREGDAVPGMGFWETETTEGFRAEMKRRGLEEWWKNGMGYSSR
ncbi:uncharacterized protein F5Z01DRAFT_633708 [Emericellopsis atlantica]|uniref:Uncharacterized protein n=1 Tax=Emericellopsis atlantica TaxID=2614577 RepID=A0A9P7ZT29_9HYPO|nr:uncharacterized protein F5Z01DRAFT_633708 [Emericellopsis atlantica]KAG9257799.1 hypothetical protein F5Z01DRAFT_633708 [Emericellopsis atlantica]